jgi:hypothetical protein
LTDVDYEKMPGKLEANAEGKISTLTVRLVLGATNHDLALAGCRQWPGGHRTLSQGAPGGKNETLSISLSLVRCICRVECRDERGKS